MASLYRDLIKILKANGCYFLRSGKGDHEIWFSPLTNKTLTLDRGTKSRHTINAILTEASLPKNF